MVRAGLYEKIIDNINILNNYSVNTNWDNLPDSIKAEFGGHKQFETIVYIKNFIENVIDEKRRQLDENNLNYRILVSNFKLFEAILKNVKFLGDEETIESVFENEN